MREFDSSAKQVLVRAIDESERLGHGYVAADHIFIAILKHPDGPAARYFDKRQIASFILGIERELAASGQVEDHLTRGGGDCFDDRNTAEQAARTLIRFLTLSPRENQILRLLNLGKSIHWVAGELGVAPGTVRNHISRILGKTETQSQVEALAMARICGFLGETRGGEARP